MTATHQTEISKLWIKQNPALATSHILAFVEKCSGAVSVRQTKGFITLTEKVAA